MERTELKEALLTKARVTFKDIYIGELHGIVHGIICRDKNGEIDVSVEVKDEKAANSVIIVDPKKLTLCE